MRIKALAWWSVVCAEIVCCVFVDSMTNRDLWLRCSLDAGINSMESRHDAGDFVTQQPANTSFLIWLLLQFLEPPQSHSTRSTASYRDYMEIYGLTFDFDIERNSPSHLSVCGVDHGSCGALLKSKILVTRRHFIFNSEKKKREEKVPLILHGTHSHWISILKTSSPLFLIHKPL